MFRHEAAVSVSTHHLHHSVSRNGHLTVKRVPTRERERERERSTQQQHRHGNAMEAFGVWEKSAIIQQQTAAPDGSQAAGNSVSQQASGRRTTWRCEAAPLPCRPAALYHDLSPFIRETIRFSVSCQLAVCWLFAEGFLLHQHHHVGGAHVHVRVAT